MKGIAGLAALLATVGIAAAFAAGHQPKPHKTADGGCAGICLARVTALALWQVWNQIDCDDEDQYLGAPPTCADDAQNVNRAATVRDFRTDGRFTAVTVDIAVGNVLNSYRVRVDRQTWQALAPTVTR